MNISVSISDDDELGIKALETMKSKLKTTRQSLSNEFRNWLVNETTPKLVDEPNLKELHATNKGRASGLASSLGKGVKHEPAKPKS